MTVNARKGFICSGPFCRRAFSAIKVKDPKTALCPECAAERERERLREAKRKQRERLRGQSLVKPAE